MSWKSELADSLTLPHLLAEHFDVDPSPLVAVSARYPMRITPHTLKLIKSSGDPIWRQAVPDPAELVADDLPEDSLNEAHFSPTAAVVHRYPDRALLLVSGACPGYCRFCTRKSRVGTSTLCFSAAELDAGIDYIAATPSIRDVILTGGDPLLLEDQQLCEILDRLCRISHIEIVRIGSRVPVTLPARITAELCQQLRRFAPLYLNTHFNHPRELTPASAQSCGRLVDAGIVLGNQTVLLRGVNDNAATMAELCRGLLRLRVRPYYLHQLDQVKGTGHFRVPKAQGLAIMAALRGQISGLAIPHYVQDPPDGSGKVLVMEGGV
ncbi:MAG: lysine 2,3-aminomutase [Desulfuromonas sp.]|nr:MAG: lysine 2,3-aminomutase [Desulfuromonas sp.]